MHAALATVIDPELRRPITELGMVDAVEVSDGGRVRVAVLLTIAGCPLRGPSPPTARRRCPPCPVSPALRSI